MNAVASSYHWSILVNLINLTDVHGATLTQQENHVDDRQSNPACSPSTMTHPMGGAHYTKYIYIGHMHTVLNRTTYASHYP